MSFPFYVDSVLLLDRTQAVRANALVNEGPVVNGDLSNWKIRREWTHVGVSKTSNAVLTLRIDNLGTFIRAAPILVDQDTKNKYLIEIKISQGGINGQTFRGMIGEPTIQDDEQYGEILSVTLVGLQYIAKEHLTSEKYEFITPKANFENRLGSYNGNSGADGPILNPLTINLPNDESLKQNWIPFEPTYIHDLLIEVIERLADPLSGTFTDYYFDYIPSSTSTLTFDVIADVFGGVDSGVIINPLSVSPPASEQDKTIMTDNIRYKNNCILVCSSRDGSLPREHSVFASTWEHAKIRPEWSSLLSYAVGNLVKRSFLSDPDSNKRLRFFKCILARTPTTTPPESDLTHWTEDFSTNPVSASYINFNKWLNLDDWQANMASALGFNPVGYAGYFVDWNIVKGLYDPNSRIDPTNPFQTISIKDVTRVTNSPPPNVGVAGADELYDRQRFLVGTSPTGAFIGKQNRVAEWDRATSSWQFSNAPTTGDTVNNLEKGQVLKWSGSAWVVAWGIDGVSEINFDKSSPFHICSNLGLVTGATGIPLSAIEATYIWIGPTLGGNLKNDSSRGAWLNFWFPFPRVPTIHGRVGHEYGSQGTSTSNTTMGTLDTNNLNQNRKGFIGWNRGVDSEDMGRISAIRFKLKVGLFTSTDDSAPITGLAEIPMIFWAIDKFDRVYYSNFKLRRNNAFDTVRIPFGELAPKQLFYGRGDELPKLLGYTLPWDFTLREKEYSGVEFDWRYVKGWGVMMASPYTDTTTGYYMGAQNAWYDQATQFIQQGAANWWNIIFDPVVQALFADRKPMKANALVHHSKITIDELYFEKELIVNSDDVELDNPRTIVEHLETETDYLNAKRRALAIKTRNSFFPQFWHMRASGDVRMKFGQKFKAQGPRVPTGSMDLVCAEVKHIIDHDGYFIEVLGVRKFVTSG